MKRPSPRPIKEYALGIYDGPHATPKESSDGAVFLGIKNITDDGRLDLSDIRYVGEDDLPRWTKRVAPQQGDVVFTYEATLHRYAVIPEGFRGCLGRRVALIRPDPKKADGRFLLYYFLSHKWRQVIETNTVTGATVDRIPLETFPSFPVFLPSLPEQTRIASLLSAYDELIENNRKRAALLEKSAQLLFQEWFVRLRFPGHERTGKIKGLPVGWSKGTASNAMQVLSGGTPKTTVDEYWDGEIPFFTPKDAVADPYVIETEKKLSELGLNKCNSKLYPKDTLFITARGTVGNLNLAQRPMAMNQSCYALVGNEGVPQRFLYLAMLDAIQHFRQQAVGAVFDAIVVDTFKRIPFLLPSPRTVALFSEAIDPMFSQIENLLLQNRKLKEAREILLPLLINGEISA